MKTLCLLTGFSVSFSVSRGSFSVLIYLLHTVVLMVKPPETSSPLKYQPIMIANDNYRASRVVGESRFGEEDHN